MKKYLFTSLGCLSIPVIFLLCGKALIAYYFLIATCLVLEISGFAIRGLESKDSLVMYCQFTKPGVFMIPIATIGVVLSIISIHSEYFSSDAAYMRNEYKTLTEAQFMQNDFLGGDGLDTSLVLSKQCTKSSAIAMCSGIRFMGLVTELAEFLQEYKNTGVLPNTSYSNLLPKSNVYTGDDKLILEYMSFSSIDWNEYFSLSAEEREIWSNTFQIQAQKITEKVGKHEVWNFVFIRVAFWLFYLPLVSITIRLVILFTTKSSFFRERINEITSFELFMLRLQEEGEEDIVAYMKKNGNTHDNFVLSYIDEVNNRKISITRPPASEQWMAVITDFATYTTKTIM